MSASCLYEGSVRHRRRAPRREFSYRLALVYVDLDELPRLLGGRLIRRGPGPLRVRRADLLGDRRLPLADAVRDTVSRATGAAPEGPIRVLTQPRSFGLCFNPVSFYYCFDRAGEQVEAIVAEVTNTPWRERHAYVLAPPPPQRSRLLRAGAEKRLHVSPLMGMEQRYRFVAGTPAETLSLHIEVGEAGEPVFDATLGLHRRELTPALTRRLALRDPIPSLRVFALIYGQALRARLAGASYHPHPGRARHA
jgi:DUF1365 family protein